MAANVLKQDKIELKGYHLKLKAKEPEIPSLDREELVGAKIDHKLTKHRGCRSEEQALCYPKVEICSFMLQKVKLNYVGMENKQMDMFHRHYYNQHACRNIYLHLGGKLS